VSGIKIDPKVAEAFLDVLKDIIPGAERSSPTSEVTTGSPTR